ncbi:MAG: NAD-dependent epimerase/dehydratase family protein [Spirochaetes bacterium]|nr:NAD-dependent epimerase/dehydratase family protein [Spirochaetota bacterium]
MRILITGANGFVGRYLKKELDGYGHEVWGIDFSSQSHDVISADICDNGKLHDTLMKIQPEIVYHLAAVSQVKSDDVSLVYKININGTINLLEGCVSLKGKPKFVFISSSQVYGSVPDDMHPIDEKAPINPVNHYGASKAAGEMLVRAFGCEYGLEYVIFRPFNHTGPGQNEYFVVPKIVKAFKENNSAIKLGNINAVRDFLDVRDVVRAYTMIVDRFTNGAIYNIASGKPIRIYDIVQKLIEITGMQMKIEATEQYLRPNDILKSVGSARNIQDMLGWKPEIDFITTLKDMLKE